MSGANQTRAWLRIARRELAGGLGGFWIYLACLALGAWAIAAAGSITASFNAGLEQQSRELLGGDASVTLAQRLATPEERAWLDARGKVSEAVQVDLMGRAPGRVKQVDVRGIDGAFPLVGHFTFDRDIALADVMAQRDGVWGVAASESFLKDLGVKVGDRLSLGPVKVEVRARLDEEPDRVGAPGMFEPRAILSIEALRETGMMSPGALFRSAYRLLLDPATSATFEKDLNAKWEAGGMRYRGPQDALDGLRALLAMIDTFMTVIGIAALVAGGVGVAQATSSFLESRIDSIAALKALGADSGTIRAAYGAQLAVLAGLGAAAGVALGALSPWLLMMIMGDAIPLQGVLAVYPLPLLKAFVLTMLAAAMFAAPPGTRATPPAALFRREGGEALGRVPALERGVALGAAGLLVLVAVAGSPAAGDAGSPDRGCDCLRRADRRGDPGEAACAGGSKGRARVSAAGIVEPWGTRIARAGCRSCARAWLVADDRGDGRADESAWHAEGDGACERAVGDLPADPAGPGQGLRCGDAGARHRHQRWQGLSTRARADCAGHDHQWREVRP